VAWVPEPGSLTVLASALIAMATVRNRRSRRLPDACLCADC
jgi:PEP-CTERM motif